MKSKKLGNKPKMMMFRLLFEEKPHLDLSNVLKELHLVFPTATLDEKTGAFTFPDCKIEYEDNVVSAQCVIMQADDDSLKPIDNKYFEQNWHWNEAKEIVEKCKYEIAITDFLGRSLEPRVRIVLMQQMLFALSKVCKPTVIVSEHGEKLIDPELFLEDCSDTNFVALDLVVNVRLFNVDDPNYGKLLMDTIGLHALGISDFQFFFNDEKMVTSVANRFWDYSYYLMEVGDIIKNGDTVEGINEGIVWKCEKVYSTSQPKRTVINIVTE